MRSSPATRVALVSTSIFAACSLACATSPEVGDSPDASTSGDAPASSVAAIAPRGALARARTTAHRDADFEALLVAGKGALALADDGASFTSNGYRSSTRTEVARMGALLPPRADAEWRIGPGRVERWAMRLVGKDMNAAQGALDGGLLVYEDAWPHTDVLVNAGDRGVEWMLTLRDASAPTSFAWRVTLGSDLHVRTGHLPDGSIELVDGGDETAIRIFPAFALDANGVKRAARLELVDGELRLSLDATGLAYPILVDPLASVPVWQLANSTYWSTYPNGGVMVRFGATGPLEFAAGVNTSGTYFNAAATWNGTSWTAAPSFPIAMAYAGAAYAANGKAYVYGGCTQGGASCNTPSVYSTAGSTALYVGDPTTHAWSQVCSNTNCGSGAVLNWDGAGLAAIGNQLLQFGGANTAGGCSFGSAYMTNVMDLTASATSFTQLSPAVRPNGRYGHVLVGGPNAPAAMLFGGASSGCNPYYSDTWLWTPGTGTSGTWSCVCNCANPYAAACPNEPPPTMDAASAWDEARRRFVVFGGYAMAGDTGLTTQATYDFDPVGKTWTQLCTNGGVDACGINGRSWPSAAYDPNLRQVVVVGGDAATWRLWVRGGSCTTGSQCDTGYCVNGTCCTTSSCPTCQSCALAGSEGVCSNIPALQPDTAHACAACDGAGNCKSALGVACASGSTCASGYCVNGTCCSTSSCGVGLTCANPSGTCLELAGGACTTSGQCSSGFCVDATCCTSASCPAGSHCNYGTPASGSCLEDNGQACTANAQCGSGNCVDGYCCNTACGAQCQACDVAGAVGTCVPVSGPVHGTVRAACAGSGACGASCNGTDATQCHYPGSGTACGGLSCASGVQTNVGTCDGGGGCAQTATPCGAYACGATTCKTSCTVDADCGSTSFFCTGGACQLKQPNGNACAAGNGCASGNCVSGVCCDSACTNAGYSCNLATSRGHCAKANATACAAGSECGSGFCVDGVCCDSACNGQCQACDATGLVGTCSPIQGPPHGARAACSGTGAGTPCGPTCNGTNTQACAYPSSSTKCGADTCTDGSSISTFTRLGTCNGAGSCSSSSGDCSTYKCNGSMCLTACATKSDCQVGNYCNAGLCVPIQGLGKACTDPTACPSGYCVDGVCCSTGSCASGASCDTTPLTAGRCTKLLGQACSANAECGSGFCVDGFCCGSSCTNPCEACNVSGKEGTCVPIVGQPKPGHPACSATPGDLVCGLACNGTDATACHDAPTTTSCGGAGCSGGTETDVTTCDGAGNCPLVRRTCGAYQCGATQCLTACVTDADCAGGSFCKSGSCVGAQDPGNPCNEDAQCKSAHCTDGVCCSVASCGAGAACAGLGPSAGLCLKGDGIACAASSECASGHCVDGVCCDKGCDGQCEACDVTGSEGTCTPVTGPPHRARPACDALAGDDCAKATCDGATRDKCGGFANGTTTPCGADACASDGKLQKHGACDGHGACATPVPQTCDGYLTCDPSTKACKTSCTADGDCQTAFRCETTTGQCVPGASCSADRTQSTDKTGVVTSCAPYLCGTDGTCMKACATSEDCVSGTSCDDTTKACIGVAAATQSGGGCAVEAGGATSRGGLGALVGVVALLGVRRSRRRRSSAVGAR